MRRTLLLLLCLLGACYVEQLPAHAQPIYHLYGVSAQNELIEIDISDPAYPQRIVAAFPFPNIAGLGYDSVSNRVLAINNAGVLYSVDQDTAALTMIQDFSSDVTLDAERLSDALAFDDSPLPSNPAALFFSIRSTIFLHPNQIVRTEQDNAVFTTVMPPFNYMAPPLGIRGMSVRKSDGTLFAVQVSYFPVTASDLVEIDKQDGTILSTVPVNLSDMNLLFAIAFHPTSDNLYGITNDNTPNLGNLFEIDPSSGNSTLLQSYPNSVSGLAFLPVTPTPTPTATPTATASPTVTPTVTPTTPVCLGDPECGCDLIKVDLGQDTSLCAPLQTLTKQTIPDAPEVIIRGTAVTLLLERFDAVINGKSLESLLGKKKPREFFSSSESLDTEELKRPKRKIGVRYEIDVQKTDSRTRDLRKFETKKDEITVRHLPPGRYAARYRVKITRGDKLVGYSRFSRRTSFKILQNGDMDTQMQKLKLSGIIE